ncbi:MAG TPA: T9SS type A sorting domain-containing protein, partial [Saprospiraceae bacterium]|nr:T9SS type A sorting domain-containing protein [Saprospiraceae bacterium]
TSDENDIDLNITVINPKSEVVLPFYFFEGGTSIEGTVNGVEVTGVGFAELLHRYEKPEIELIAPSIDWSVDLPIVWQLNNDDDGRAVFYDIDVSYDDKETYQKIAQHLEDTQFLWTATDFPQDGLYWFKITGYSIDSTLVGVVETEVSYPLTEISEQFIQEGWRLYPNPAREAFYIDVPPQIQGAITVKLINESGQPVKNIVWDKAPNQFTIETRQLVAGNYFLEISSSNYNVVQMVTVVK